MEKLSIELLKNPLLLIIGFIALSLLAALLARLENKLWKNK